MKRISAIAVALLGYSISGDCVLFGDAVSSGAYQLSVQLPATIVKGKTATLILHVAENGKPAGSAVTCLNTAPVFISVEDALDTTPAGGSDLGTGPKAGMQTGCRMGLAGEQSGPGTYAFSWEPDTAGRVNLTFTAGAGLLTVPVDVASSQPSPAILILFLFALAAVLSTAACVHRHRRPEGIVP